MIYARTVRRELWNFLVFEDISIFGIFEGNRKSRSGVNCGYGTGNGNNIEVKIVVKVNCSSKGFFVTSNISDHEQKELVVYWIDLLGRKNLREIMFWKKIRSK